MMMMSMMMMTMIVFSADRPSIVHSIMHSAMGNRYCR